MFSSKAIMVKLSYGHGAGTLEILLLRMVFALPVYLCSILLSKNSRADFRKGDIFWILFFGIIGYYLASYFDFLGLRYIKAGLERLVLFVYPSLVIIIGYVLLKKPILKRQVTAIIITYLGLVVVLYADLDISTGDQVLLGAFLVFLSALTYAGYLVGSGWMIPRLGVVPFTAYCMTVSCLMVIAHYYLEGNSTKQILELPKEVLWIGVLMALVATIIPSYLISYAIKGLGSSRFAIFASLGPVSTIVLAYIFLGEKLSLLQFIGGVIIVGGVIYGEKKKAKRN